MMDRWSGRIAVITGASAGIGHAIAKELVKQGLIVVGLARNEDKLKALSIELQGSYPSKFHYHKCNIRSEEDIAKAFSWIRQNVGVVSVLVNNAGVGEIFTLLDATMDKINSVMETNVGGLIICTREAVKSMVENSINDGHIININSLFGHSLLKFTDEIEGNVVYAASKHAARIVSQGLGRELLKRNTQIKTTSISPGATHTEMLMNTVTQITGKPEIPHNLKPLNPKDVADTVVFALQTPPHVQIPQLIVLPVSEEY